MKIIKIIVEDLFPENLFIKKSFSYSTDGKHKNKTSFKLLLDENQKNYHNYLYSFRKKAKEIDFIDTYKPDIEDIL